MRPTSCVIDLRAIRNNVQELREMVAPTPVCAVVKANAYGHGAVSVAEAAIDAGATCLAVALVEEGVELRQAGVRAPILLLSEPPAGAMSAVVYHSLTPSLYTMEGVAAASAATAPGDTTRVQVLVDTGMRRVGADPADVRSLVDAIAESVNLVLDGVWTHCPVADEPDNPFTERQFARFDALVAELPAGVSHHVANSAAAITRPQRPGAMVRCGIATYGLDPAPALEGMVSLEPALRLTSAVSFVKRIGAGEGVGYGLRWSAPAETTIATVPIGYADGVRRDYGLRGGGVLIDGTRHPIRGVVTMDQLMVDVGHSDVSIGDEVVLIGTQGGNEILVAEVAATLDTIAYEVVCAISERVPRVYLT